MEPKLNFIHVCDYASMSEGGKVNILGIFKNINIFGQNFPVTHPQLYVVSNVSVTNSGIYKQKLKLIDENNEEIIPPLPFSSNVVLGQDGTAEIGLIANLVALEFPKLGVYKFVLDINDVKIAEIPITLTLKART